MRRRIPHPPGHYEAEERTRTRVAWVLGALVLAATLWAAIWEQGFAIGVILWSPLPGGVFAWWLLRGGSEQRYWLRWLLMRHDEGRHIDFEGFPIDIDITEGRILVGAQGVFHALDAEFDQATVRRLALRYPGEGFQRRGRTWWFGEQALFHWLDSRGDRHRPASVRFRTWFEREVLPGLRKELTGG